MANKFICVEVGDRLTKVAVCVGNEKKRKIINGFMFENTDGTVVDGEIDDPQNYALHLKSQLENNGCADVKEVLFTVSSPKIATHWLKMPVVVDQKIQSVIDNNKADYFPLELENYTVMFRVLSRNKNKKKGDLQSVVLVIAVPNDILTACVDIARGLNLRLKGVDTVFSSLADGAILLKQNKVTALVHVDCTMTNIVFMRGTEFLLQRSLSLGGDGLISAYREAVSQSSYGKDDDDDDDEDSSGGGNQISYMKALRQLCHDDAEDYVRGKLNNAELRELLDELVGTIDRSMSFFHSRVEGVEVEQILLVGPCANLYGLETFIDDDTEIDTSQVNSLLRGTPLDKFEPDGCSYVATVYCGHHGLNFAKHLIAKKGKRANGGFEVDLPTAILLFILLTVFAVYWGYSVVLTQNNMETELSKLNSEIEAMAHLDVIAATHKSYADSKTLLLDFTKKTENPNESLLLFLAELEAKMPSEILLLNMACTGTNVTMSMTVNSITAASTVVQKLRTFESIGMLQVSGLAFADVEDVVSGEIGRQVNFSIVCTYGTNVYTSGFHPYADIIGVLNVPVEPATPDGSAATE